MRRLALLLLLFALPAFGHPSWGIVTDAAGNVYFSDLNHVWRIDHRTGALTLAHRGSADVHIHEISPDPARGFAAGPPHGYSVELDNHRKEETLIRKNGRLFAGGAYGFADGTGTRARFRNIVGMTVGPGGDLYVTDDDAVRRITPAAVVTTIARNLTAPDPQTRERFSFGGLFGLAVTPSTPPTSGTAAFCGSPPPAPCRSRCAPNRRGRRPASPSPPMVTSMSWRSASVRRRRG